MLTYIDSNWWSTWFTWLWLLNNLIFLAVFFFYIFFVYALRFASRYLYLLLFLFFILKFGSFRRKMSILKCLKLMHLLFSCRCSDKGCEQLGIVFCLLGSIVSFPSLLMLAGNTIFSTHLTIPAIIVTTGTVYKKAEWKRKISMSKVWSKWHNKRMLFEKLLP